MSVEVAYPGKFGNNLFQYVFARLFCKRSGLKLVTDFNHNHIVSMTPPPHGFQWSTGSVTEIGEGEWSLDKRWPPGRYLVKGFFQRADLYYKNRQEIFEFAHPVTPPSEQSSQDLVVNFRIDHDYRQHLAIHPSWYQGILATEPYRRLFVVSDVNDLDYFRYALAGHKYEIYNGTPKEQWDFLRGFERVVMSNSTFCWWAVFFGRARKSFIFKRWIASGNVILGGFPGAIEVDGHFLFEKPVDWQPPAQEHLQSSEPVNALNSNDSLLIPLRAQKKIVFPSPLKVADVLAELKKASPPFGVVSVGADVSKTYIYLHESEGRDPMPILERLSLAPVFKRNLCFYVYPKNPEGWRWHVSRIQDYWGNFNGKKVVTVATDKSTESSEAVIKSFSDRSIEFICVENDSNLWETKHFIEMIRRVCSVDPNEATFYAHAKGVIHGEEQLKRVRQWCEVMYVMNLERPDLIDKVLMRYAAAGCFQDYFAVRDWIFSGTFFWFKHSSIFSKAWTEIGTDKYAVEKYLSRHIRIKEAKALTPYWNSGELYGNPPQEGLYRGWLRENLRVEGLQ